MKNQSGTIKTNLELDRVVIGGSGGYRRLPGGSDDFSLQTNTQTLHHNIYIAIVIISPVRRPCQVVAYVTAPDCHIPLASLPQCTLTLAKDLQEYLFALFFFGIQT